MAIPVKVVEEGEIVATVSEAVKPELGSKELNL